MRNKGLIANYMKPATPVKFPCLANIDETSTPSLAKTKNLLPLLASLPTWLNDNMIEKRGLTSSKYNCKFPTVLPISSMIVAESYTTIKFVEIR